MRKSTLFIIFLLCIVAAELVMLFKGCIGSKEQEYVLDSKVYDMPVREAEYNVVKPFLFELHSADEVDAILNEFAADVVQSMADKEAVAEMEIKAPAAEEQVLLIEDEKLAEPEAEIAEVVTEQEESTTDETAVDKVVNEVNVPKENEVVAAEEVKEVVAEPKEIAETKPEEKAVKSDNLAKVAIVIDDVGLSVPFTKQIAQVRAPLTVSFLPYGASNKEQVTTLKDAGFEVMVHVPMMPHVPAALAPVTLSPEMDKAETQAELNKMLDRFEGTGMTGVNNHMGSLLTERVKNMGYIMEVLKNRGMFFLDSKTTGKSAAGKSAEEYGVTYISRDVFLDNKNDYNYIMGQFRQLEKVAKKNGYAVAIGHPYSQTLNVLKDWLKEAESNGIEVVHLSDLLVK